MKWTLWALANSVTHFIYETHWKIAANKHCVVWIGNLEKGNTRENLNDVLWFRLKNVVGGGNI